MTVLAFTVPGSPVPMGRPRFSKHVYTDKRSTEYRNRVALCAKLAGAQPLDGPLHLTVTFRWAYPKSFAKKKRVEHHKPNGADLDNLIKGLMDSLNGIAYHDDAQVVMLTADKLYSKRAYTSVTIEPAEEPAQ